MLCLLLRAHDVVLSRWGCRGPRSLRRNWLFKGTFPPGIKPARRVPFTNRGHPRTGWRTPTRCQNSQDPPGPVLEEGRSGERTEQKRTMQAEGHRCLLAAAFGWRKDAKDDAEPCSRYQAGPRVALASRMTPVPYGRLKRARWRAGWSLRRCNTKDSLKRTARQCPASLV